MGIPQDDSSLFRFVDLGGLCESVHPERVTGISRVPPTASGSYTEVTLHR